MKILVTGGSGLVGQSLKKILPEAVYISSKEYNLISALEVARMMTEHHPDAVIHLAAKVGGIQDNINSPCDYYEENAAMNLNIVRACRNYGVKRLIAILSTCAYPNVASKYPMTEDQLHESPPAPTNFGYGLAKRAMASHIDACNKQYGTKFQYLIPSNIYGIGEKYDVNKTHFLGALIHKIFAAQQAGQNMIEVWGSGKAQRQFLFADDLARVIKLCLDNEVYESFNVAPEENRTIENIISIAFSACRALDRIPVFDSTKPDGQIMKQASNNKMKSIFPDFGFTPLHTGIGLVYDELIKNK